MTQVEPKPGILLEDLRPPSRAPAVGERSLEGVGHTAMSEHGNVSRRTPGEEAVKNAVQRFAQGCIAQVAAADVAGRPKAHWRVELHADEPALLDGVPHHTEAAAYERVSGRIRGGNDSLRPGGANLGLQWRPRIDPRPGLDLAEWIERDEAVEVLPGREAG